MTSGKRNSPTQVYKNNSVSSSNYGKPETAWRASLYTIIFESDTRAGRLFDLWLIAAIALSVSVVILDSVEAISTRMMGTFDVIEWSFTLLFTLEYLVRLSCVRYPLRYATSVFGIIDLLSILPSYLAIFMPEAQVLIDIRILRLMRIFRILKLMSYVEEYSILLSALSASRRKIMIFLSFVMMVVLLLGTAMYVIEGPEHGFTSIPTSVYWAITAVTTVGFGDIVPKTDLGRGISSLMMLIGWGTLAVPTGILSAELTSRRMTPQAATQTCPQCQSEGLDADANYCSRCGFHLSP